ncbi:Protein of unknown function (DUF3018) [Prauserella halophila]|nr:Protein of unknown function (DUF3018) [Prauserella halophila]
MRAHRSRLRRQGLRPIQIWVPDTSSPEFARAAHEQSVAVAESERGTEDEAWTEAVAEYVLGDDA